MSDDAATPTDGADTPAGADTQPSGPADSGGPDAGAADTHRSIDTPDEAAGPAPELAHRRSPARPPRRTGIFVDPDDLRGHVGELLRTILGGYEVDAFGNHTFVYEGARIVVTVGPSPVGPQIGVFSVTNLDLDLTPELGRLLLTTNHTLGFGSFSYDERNRAVWLRHTLLGTTLVLPELQAAVAAVATAAAHLDDVITERFGGRTFDDAPADVRERMEPPEPEQTDPGVRHGVRGYL